ncbi:MAG: endonuclease Q family protein [Candidatus Parvarchaeota archaeon]|nr:endonuclease Q family protein [Candidatus Jingweiarchaeum tengchongense]MCW1298597.1 endonuclease Q family protein [Candidatus Jingweiarchaeum tengchongense]MCW1300443.1 endonuclease Q family protein [Candidatus Jingweiarchaeum tengchongense]MCW1304621.1 endonuclease Q family protein [Candidatus Jingweiarchaeum tengchongense]MCW1306001.1 endonuclease Q family protein [Candidatus Jingweiarchaeum tengchongense]
MQIIADLHIHSKYARATSKEMDLEHLSTYSKIKGINLLGTGDCTHPSWFSEIKKKLKERRDGIYDYNQTNFIITGEIRTIYKKNDKLRKVDHLILVPNIEVCEQMNDSLKNLGNLRLDGRASFYKSAPEIVEKIIEISKDIMIIPAHIWTSWYGVLGEFSDFNKIDECYEDQTKHIHALETGLSSDPMMNWRLSSLDKFTLVSNSDSHSPWPWRLGREVNVFEINDEKFSYKEIVDAIKKKDRRRFLFTIECNPEYGKYHFDGHRKCNVSLSPKEAIKNNNICPVCGKKLTIGVLHRVELLADREEGFVPKDAIPFKTLLPLYEIISHALKVNQLYSKKVIEEQDKLIKHFKNEFNVLLNVDKEELMKVTDEVIVDAIMKVRNNEVKVIPGYDGVYGKPVFSESEFNKFEENRRKVLRRQSKLGDYS